MFLFDDLLLLNHQIIVGDCLVELDKFKEQNSQFDFVFSDLTDIPISAVPQNKEWQFLTAVLEKSLGLLRENGTFLTHVRVTFKLMLKLHT